jgi:hypothetical protein
VEKKAFRLFKNGRELRCEVLSLDRWKILSASRETGFVVGDEVCPARTITWQEARRRVNSGRSALSPNGLVLLRGDGYERSELEIGSILRSRPWEPEAPKPA